MKIGNWKITPKDGVWFVICLLLIISFLSGKIIVSAPVASEVVSGASTVASIILSVIAILYTMIEGANSFSMNQVTISKLAEIDTRVDHAIEQQKRIRELTTLVLEEVKSQTDKLQGVADDANPITISRKAAQQLDDLRKYLADDIEV